MQEIQNSGFRGFAEVVFHDPRANGAAPICRSVADHTLKSVSETGTPPLGEDAQSFPDISGSPIIGPPSEDGRSGIKPPSARFAPGGVISTCITTRIVGSIEGPEPTVGRAGRGSVGECPGRKNRPSARPARVRWQTKTPPLSYPQGGAFRFHFALLQSRRPEGMNAHRTGRTDPRAFGAAFFHPTTSTVSTTATPFVETPSGLSIAGSGYLAQVSSN